MKYYDVGVSSIKLGKDKVPSAETTSVVFGLFSPPRSITSPDSRPQHKWNPLGSNSLTGSNSKFFQ